MFEAAVSVRIVRLYIIEVTFEDGAQRSLDIEPYLDGEVFASLRDPDVFAQAAIDPTFGSVFWPTGADLAPEFLYYGAVGPPPGYYGGSEGSTAAAAPVISERR